ncbi:hypothetical protein ACWDY7_01440 [Streptomyces calvus]|uniref:Uncharacterized protein n=1 Tax=Streptomyces calvus TaxID=67282 RepID=A0AA40SB65_9ACTN|nr:hypothetical protein [Streptomyces calvus]MBA8943088.1 hypothetical protein [Streptomyces calvus]GGP35108.1 hypothetical protein GCM10010247_03580 [Streptomyces calvus]
MDMGDVPAWAALVVSVGAVVVSLKARSDGSRAADAAEKSVIEAKRSADASEQAVVEARRSSDASERSAAVAEETLEDQRREAAERRAAEAEANRPRAALCIEHANKAMWHLANYGTGPAENIVCVDEVEAMIDDWPAGLSLAPGEVHDFMMVGSMQASIPPVLRVKWDGQDEPVPLRVPPRIG